MNARISSTAISLFMLLFALSAVLGILPAYDPSLSVEALAIILFSIALYFLLAHTLHSMQALRLAATVGLLIATVFAAYFITQYGYQDYPEKGGLIARLGQLTTILPNLGGFTPFPNAMATFLEVAVSLGIALFVSGSKPSSKAAWAVSTLVIVYAIFLTASRGAWLALGVTAGIAITFTILARLPRQTANKIIGIGVAVALIGLIAIVALGPERLPFLSSTFSRATDRGRLFLNSLYLAGDYAFTGAGLGDTFAMVYSRYSLLIQVPFLTYAHNLPLSIWLNQGLLGLIAMAGIVISFYGFVYQVNRTAQPSALFHGAWLGVTVTLLHGLTDAPQYSSGNRWVMPMLFVWLGLAVASGRLALRDVQFASARPLFAYRRVALIGAILLVLLAIVFHRPLIAAWNTNLGAIAETRAELAPGLSEAQRLEGFGSANAAYHAALGIEPAHANASRRAGSLAVKLDRFAEAVPLLEAAWARETSNPAAIKGLGLAYVWVGRAADAARMFLQLDDPAAMESELYVWGNFRTEQNRPLLAAYAYETAQAMLPDAANATVRLLIADSYRAAGQIDAARLWYNRVLEAEPDNARALAALAEIQQ
jgi:O-antigen ligase